MTAPRLGAEDALARLRRRDAGAWTDLFREQAARMLGVARRLSSSEADAEEAVQDGFLAA